MAGGTREMLTLSVQEVVNQDVVTATGLERGVLEALAGAGAVAHVLLAEALDMLFNAVSILPCG
jgi:hypothetical protein